MLTDLGFSLAITAPIFSMLGFGILFKRIGWISDEFAKVGSDLVFKVTLPCLLFVKLVETDFLHNLPIKLILYAVLATITIFLIIDRIVAVRLQSSFDRGAFVQGSFRSNMGIIGLAFCTP